MGSSGNPTTLLISIAVALILTTCLCGCAQPPVQAPAGPGAPPSPQGGGAPAFTDEFGCLPADCSTIPDARGRQFCEQAKAGTYTWALCSGYPEEACRKLCEKETARKYAGMTEFEVYAEKNREERHLPVRGRVAQRLIPLLFENLTAKSRSPMPMVRGANIGWLCGATQRGEAYFLEEFAKEARAMKRDLGIDYAMVNVPFIENPRKGESGFLPNEYAFGARACGDYTRPEDQLIYPRPRLPPEDMRKVIRALRAEGLAVILELGYQDPVQAPPASQWNGLYTTDLEAFLGEYQGLIMPYVRMAGEEKVEIIKVGIEREEDDDGRNAIRNRMFGDVIIPSVRKEYPGALTYGENVPFLDRITFWDRLDYIGVDFWSGLTGEKDPTVPELQEAIGRIYDASIRPVQERYRKPVLFAELGYLSFDGNNRDCGGGYRCQYIPSPLPPVDPQEQADEYAATFRFMERTPEIAGAVIFNPGYGVTGW